MNTQNSLSNTLKTRGAVKPSVRATLPKKSEWGCDRPLAIAGLVSYRCRGQYGWIMIGATDHEDALREARRSWEHATSDRLQVWNGNEYVGLSQSVASPALAERK